MRCHVCGTETAEQVRCLRCGASLVPEAQAVPVRRRSRPERGRLVRALGAVVVAGAVAAGALWFTRSGDDGVAADDAGGVTAPTESSPTAVAVEETRSVWNEAAAQATEVDVLLDSSRASRGRLGSALQSLLNCTSVRSATRTVATVTESRREQLARSRTLVVDDIPGGAELKRALVRALDASYQADVSFPAVGQERVRGGGRHQLPARGEGVRAGHPSEAGVRRPLDADRPFVQPRHPDGTRDLGAEI
ncbi:hypothetical protein Aph01nite_53780 [Acrocarpospora phusangensis]|uniref:Uncharacterized protein n=1 Tax=Acrocarpospora phusangensis TaxID=1070424 RepID=A0A919QE51_9ACTN|nr:hypothetical protein [Acrocarpospora phusangensis]GIH27068.1 hypothetical protein Aph01nite_53780 [Acrocarpospora phusangensis]